MFMAETDDIGILKALVHSLLAEVERPIVRSVQQTLRTSYKRPSATAPLQSLRLIGNKIS